MRLRIWHMSHKRLQISGFTRKRDTSFLSHDVNFQFANKTGFYPFIVSERSCTAAPSFARNWANISVRRVTGHVDTCGRCSFKHTCKANSSDRNKACRYKQVHVQSAHSLGLLREQRYIWHAPDWANKPIHCEQINSTLNLDATSGFR